MKIFSAEDITKTYGEKVLFKHISFHIGEKERIGIIGVNGTGKSSLLNLVSGQDEPDSGYFNHPKDYSIGYLMQAPVLEERLTILEQVFKGDSPAIRLTKEHEETLSELEKTPGDESIQQRLFHIQKQMDAAQAWEASTNAKTILSKLGLHDTSLRVGELSGGQKKRVALAQVLIETPDLLILDEPTNHLDYNTIHWLEDYLAKYPKSVMFVTHDRYFLDQVANRIIELDGGNLYTYQGNYQSFIEAKALREEQEAHAEEKRKNTYRRELAWMRRGAKARSTKQKARIQRFENLEAEMANSGPEKNMDIAMKGSRLGKQVFEFVNAYKSFGDRIILEDFNFLIKPGDRIGIVGENGSGKSTLLNILAGRLQLDRGEMISGQTVRIGYYTQDTEGMDDSQRMISYIREAGEVAETVSGEMISATQMLERFLFPASTHGTPIRKLSGGEKRRLYLLKLLMAKPNVLLLDEPTNDLDTETLTVLESYLDEFPGVVISVSHDRYFLDKAADQLIVFAGKGNIERFYGSYSDYLETRFAADDNNQPKNLTSTSPVKKKEEQKKKRMSYSEQKEWEVIEDKIVETEEKIDQLNASLNEAGSDFSLAQQIMEDLNKQNEQLELLIDRWTYLSELNS
ncbi:MAG TPA: ABC-F family ATP-binding cassette domain-containing protein [Bacillaceae bacterium]